MLKARLGPGLDRALERALPFVTRLRVSPDALTLGGVFASAASGTAFALEAPVGAGLLLVLAGGFDLIDGVVARHQGRASSAGAFLDSTMDRVSDLLVFTGIAYAMARRADAAGVLLVFWAVLGAFLTSYARASAERRLANLSAGIMERAERWLVLIAGALSGFLHAALLVVALGSSFTAVQRVIAARRLLRILDESGLDPTLEQAAKSARGEEESHG